MQAHLFVFWFALHSTITPPVCGAMFIAAGMAETPWIPVAGQAIRLGIWLYLVPLDFIANPSLIHPEEGISWAILAFAKISVGLYFINRGLIGGNIHMHSRLAYKIVGVGTIFTLVLAVDLNNCSHVLTESCCNLG